MKYNCKDIYDNPDNFYDFLHISGYLIYLFTNEVNNKHYVGDTTINLYFRLYFNKHWKGHFIHYDNGTDSHLYNAMRKYGLQDFSLEIIYKGEYDDDLEGYYIDKYDSFYNGYNESLSGKPFNKGSNVLGKIRINDGITEKWVKPDEVDYWLGLGFKVGNKPGHGFEGVNKYLDDHPGMRSDISKRAYKTVLDSHNGIHPMIEAANTDEAKKRRYDSNRANHGGILAWNTEDAKENVIKSLETKYGHRNGICGRSDVRAKATEKYVFYKDGNYRVMSKNAHGYNKNGYTRICALSEWSDYCINNNIINNITSDQGN